MGHGTLRGAGRREPRARDGGRSHRGRTVDKTTARVGLAPPGPPVLAPIKGICKRRSGLRSAHGFVRAGPHEPGLRRLGSSSDDTEAPGEGHASRGPACSCESSPPGSSVSPRARDVREMERRKAASLYGVGPFGLEPQVLCMVITLLRRWPALGGRGAKTASSPRRVFPLGARRALLESVRRVNPVLPGLQGCSSTGPFRDLAIQAWRPLRKLTRNGERASRRRAFSSSRSRPLVLHHGCARCTLSRCGDVSGGATQSPLARPRGLVWSGLASAARDATALRRARP